MESSSTVRRRAWINSSRHWSTLEEPIPSASTVDDDVFSDGCFTGKIEDWLLGCGSDSSRENSTQVSFDSAQQASNCTDDLSLGADACLINGGNVTSKASLKQHPSSERLGSTRHRRLCPPSLNLGQSMASSYFSSSTWKSTSSVSDILDRYSEDAEETLFELGFGCEEPQVTVRIPPRFFTFPSQARGINFRLFLDSQLRRIREEDPSLSLASRFRQVQVLTAMANAFYSLYSHVSRTPLQKLETPEFTFTSSPVERLERFRTSVRSEPRSPVERLKDTVNKMCLYPGSPRGSDSTSPQPSPRRRSSLPEIVDLVRKNKTRAVKKLDLGERNLKDSLGDVQLLMGGCGSCKSDETKQSVEDADRIQKENKMDKTSEVTDSGENGAKQNEFNSRTVKASPRSASARQTLIESGHKLLSCRPESDSRQQDTHTAELKPVAKAAFDRICQQITESVHRASFSCQDTQNSTRICEADMKHISICEAESKNKPRTHESERRTALSEEICTRDVPSAEEVTHADPFRSSVLENNCRATQCSITVTGWEGDDVSSCSLNPTNQSFHQKEKQYLNPHHGLGRLSTNLQQVNSFELEEVHSAGEEDFGLSVTRAATSSFSIQQQHKGGVVRGDSMQSDSSGYADEEVGPSIGQTQ